MYEVEGVWRRGRANKTWTEIVEKECQPWQLKEDAMDRSK